MPGTVLAPGDSVVKETVKIPPLLRHTKEKNQMYTHSDVLARKTKNKVV